MSVLEDSGKRDGNGRYDVKFLPLADLNSWDLNEYSERLIFLDKEHCPFTKSFIKELRAPASLTICSLEFRSWKGVILNVPGTLAALAIDTSIPIEPSTADKFTPENEKDSLKKDSLKKDSLQKVSSNEDSLNKDSLNKDSLNKDTMAALVGSQYAILVSRRSNAPAPILVLAGLRYRGNVGTIIRSAVQSNRFSAIIIIDPDPATPKVPGEKLSHNRIAPVDVDYYSMQNAPLIEIKRESSIAAFMSSRDTSRSLIATALNDRSIDCYDAGQFLRNPNIYLLLGCETSGLPPFVTDEESCTSLEIPSLSASINVGCAFSVVLTCLILAQKT